MFMLAIVLYALQRFGSPQFTGWVAFAVFVPGLIASPFLGALLERLRAPLAIAVDLLMTACVLLALAFLDRAEQLGPGLLITLVTMCSLTGPLSASGIRVLIPRLVPNEGLERANALDTGRLALIELVGPALGGTLIGLGGPAAAMLVIASLYALAAVSLIPVLRAAPRLPADRSMSLLQAAVAGVTYIVRHRSLRGLAICYSVYQISWGVLVVVVPVAVTGTLGSTVNADMIVGALWSGCGCAGALGALVTGKWHLIGRGRQLIVFCFAAIAVAIYPLSASFGLFGLAAGLTVIGLLEGPADVALLTLRQRRTEPQWLGRVLTVSMCLNMSGFPLGSVIGGWLVTYSVDFALIAAATASLIAAVRAFLLIPAADESSHSNGGMLR
jgi:MFS family permease